MRICLTVSLVWLLVSCEQRPREPLLKNSNVNPEFDLVTAHTEIKKLVETNFVQGFRRQDSLAMAENFAPEGVIMPPHSPAVRGQDAATHWARSFHSGITDLKITSLSLTGNEEQLVETGSYQLFSKGKLYDKGKYMAVWKRSGTSWKMHYDIWNSDLPAVAGTK